MTNNLVVPTFAESPAIATDHTMAQRAMAVFFAAEISNRSTRRAYQDAARDFFSFASSRPDIAALSDVGPLHVAAWLELMKAKGLAAATIKQRLAGLKMLFQSLVRQSVLSFNPAEVVKGPRHSVSRGKTPVLDGAETSRLLDSIDTSTLIGLRDRAMIATMAYTFARISAVTSLRVRDAFRQKQRLWLRLSEKGGKSKDVPCHHQLEHALADWLEATGLRDHPDAPLFQTFGTRGARASKQEAAEAAGHAATTASHTERSGKKLLRPLSSKPMSQPMTWEMIQRRKTAAGIETAVCNHTFRATGITAYLSNGGTIERAATIAGHASTRTTQLYDRRPDDVTLDEIERIRFTDAKQAGFS